MATNTRRKGRTWATEHLLTNTTTFINAVQWYELAAPHHDTTEVQVTARGQQFSRLIANRDLEADACRSSLAKLIEGLASEIDASH